MCCPMSPCGYTVWYLDEKQQAWKDLQDKHIHEIMEATAQHNIIYDATMSQEGRDGRLHFLWNQKKN